MPESSYYQQQYICRQKREKKFISFLRIFILLLFLILVEISARSRTDRLFYLQQSMYDLAQFLQHVQRWFYFSAPFCNHHRNSDQFSLRGASGCRYGSSSVDLSQNCENHRALSGCTEQPSKSALAPLLIVWLGANERTIIVCGMSVAVFGSILNLYTGFCEADPEKLKLIEHSAAARKKNLQKSFFHLLFRYCLVL